jgi:hypothetical protein
MARKEPADSPSARGFNDIIGIVLLCLAVLLLTALLSYHPRDVSANSLPTNPAVHNWIGPFRRLDGLLLAFLGRFGRVCSDLSCFWS